MPRTTRNFPRFLRRLSLKGRDLRLPLLTDSVAVQFLRAAAGSDDCTSTSVVRAQCHRSCRRRVVRHRVLQLRGTIDDSAPEPSALIFPEACVKPDTKDSRLLRHTGTREFVSGEQCMPTCISAPAIHERETTASNDDSDQFLAVAIFSGIGLLGFRLN